MDKSFHLSIKLPVRHKSLFTQTTFTWNDCVKKLMLVKKKEREKTYKQSLKYFREDDKK